MLSPRARSRLSRMSSPTSDAESAVLKVIALPPGTTPWPTVDPFLFCVHHLDQYPAGNEQMGPDASLDGHDLGQDFAGKDGFRMYHGRVIPGFPSHPHRGFETVTIARQGLIDHADSLGAAARFGHGDVQWLTAGAGIVHSEMFPLLKRDAPNPAELFQIWLNLPRKSKMVKPYFSMLWADTVPERTVVTSVDGADKTAKVSVIAGRFGDAVAPPPPPDSWASQPDSAVAIWSLTMDAGSKLTLPADTQAVPRTLYFFAGEALSIDGERVAVKHAYVLSADREVTLEALGANAEVLVLQGRPIGEPVVQYGPFVMNSQAEIRQTFADYQRTQFGGWPWPVDDPSHGRERGRFARHADGRTEER